jgi:small-conductance mechanosensitive channel
LAKVGATGSLKRDSFAVFAVGILLTLAFFALISYFLLSLPLANIVIVSVVVVLLWLNGYRVAGRGREAKKQESTS